ncbi:hypothetical protein CEP52_012282 [Fusarium oligoseptatum]|uniref:Cleavage and polyadenylation specificity factor subunit 2 n=1 Tax=Fusarium oligoseptatum TaxID=2604345 RepID=A0A428SYY3_9HYPO|nr:hypothetical protein CEP52_012282 [Fusarium oligoseptatum]
MFTFCPLQGALSESPASQSLLELDGGVKVLVDLGWDESFDVGKLKEIEKQVTTLSLILVTHATASHLAAYAHCCKNIPQFTRIPVYATRPVIDLGRTLIQDLYNSSPAAATTIQQSSLSETAFSFAQTATTAQNLLLQSPTNEDIARYFSLIQPLKYSQPHQPLPSPFSPPLNGLTITAYNSGHTLGGTIWHIQHGLESIVYAVDWNQARENVFAGAAWLGGAGGGGAEVIEQLRKPTALICSSRGADRTAQTGGRVKRDEQLIDTIKACVTRGGTVLIPVDSSARVLELSYLLEHAWRTDAASEDGVLKAAKLYLAGRNMSSTMRYARSMLEWMDDSIVQEFEAFAEGQRKAFQKDDKPSIARTLWDWWKERKDGVSVEQTSSGDNIELVYAGGRELEIREAQRQALEGDELAVYQQWLATQRQLQATQQSGGAAGLEASADVVDDASSESSSDSEDEDGEQQGKALNVSTTIGQAGRKNVVLKDEDLGINVLIKKKGVHDFDSRGKKGRERMFPIAIRRKRHDDFGELIRPEDYLRAEEKEEDGQDNANMEAADDKLGKKRRWDDVAKNGAGANKRQQTTRAGSVDDAEPGAGDGFVPDELDSVEDIEADEPTGPCKLSYQTETITANLRIAYVDFSGLHDKRSLNMLIPLIKPRKLILVGGGRDETLALAEDCRRALGGDAADGDGSSERTVDVYTPEIGTLVDASVDTNAWVVKLADSLVKKIKWQNVRGLGIVTITGQLLATKLDDAPAGDEDAANKRQKTEESSTTALSTVVASPMPTLDVLPANLVSAVRSAAQPLHVGDLRLADLRRAMQSAGHTAEFRGEGTLVVDGTVAVRKTATGRVEVESVGMPTARRSTFYEVRKVIYDNLAVVTGA